MRKSLVIGIDKETADMIAQLQACLSPRASVLSAMPTKLEVVRAAVAQARDTILAASDVTSKVLSSSVRTSVRVDEGTAATILEIQDALSVRVKRRWHTRTRDGTIVAGRPKKSEVIKDAVTMLINRHGDG